MKRSSLLKVLSFTAVLAITGCTYDVDKLWEVDDPQNTCPNGEGCGNNTTTDSECSTSKPCSDTNKFCSDEGNCVERKNLGDECQHNGQCKSDWCEGGICKNKTTDSVECSETNPCADINKTCSEDGKCVEKISECESNEDCSNSEKGHLCDTSTRQCTNECSDAVKCPANGECHDGECIEPLICNDDSACSNKEYCCLDNLECYGNDNERNTCIEKKPSNNDSKCNDDIECESGVCLGEEGHKTCVECDPKIPNDDERIKEMCPENHFCGFDGTCVGYHQVEKGGPCRPEDGGAECKDTLVCANIGGENICSECNPNGSDSCDGDTVCSFEGKCINGHVAVGGICDPNNEGRECDKGKCDNDICVDKCGTEFCKADQPYCVKNSIIQTKETCAKYKNIGDACDPESGILECENGCSNTLKICNIKCGQTAGEKCELGVKCDDNKNCASGLCCLDKNKCDSKLNTCVCNANNNGSKNSNGCPNKDIQYCDDSFTCKDKLSLSESCEKDYQCLNNAPCVEKEGERICSCNDMNNGCEKGKTCFEEYNQCTDCKLFKCNLNDNYRTTDCKCHSKKNGNQECINDFECKSGRCNKVCLCKSDSDCNDSEYCVGESEKKNCVARVKVGKDCDDNNQCLSKMCDSKYKKCECDTKTDFGCEEGLVCGSDYLSCVKKNSLKVGESCNDNDQCLSESCNGKKCACTKDDHCETSKLCHIVTGTCILPKSLQPGEKCIGDNPEVCSHGYCTTEDVCAGVNDNIHYCDIKASESNIEGCLAPGSVCSIDKNFNCWSGICESSNSISEVSKSRCACSDDIQCGDGFICNYKLVSIDGDSQKKYGNGKCYIKGTIPDSVGEECSPCKIRKPSCHYNCLSLNDKAICSNSGQSEPNCSAYSYEEKD